CPTSGTRTDIEQIRDDFAPVAESFGMDWKVQREDHRSRVLIMVSRFGHCLNDLLYRMHIGALKIDVPAIVSNHPDLKEVADWYSIPFHYLPVTPQTKLEAEEALLEIIE